MALTPGTRLCVYDITAPIGAGGPASARADFEGALLRGLAEAEAER